VELSLILLKIYLAEGEAGKLIRVAARKICAADFNERERATAPEESHVHKTSLRRPTPQKPGR
jgi:hypothetical protein